jgi:molybdopterin/thiamine biosynthesis adenylyltransferase
LPDSEEVFLYPDSPEQVARSRTANRSGRVLLVGIGALGCPAAATLVRSPLARLTLIDPDRVEASNLQRQILFATRDLGRAKVDVAAERLGGAGVEVIAIHARLAADNAAELIAAHHLVIDACDDPATKFLINATAVRLGLPFSYGGVTRTSGLTMTVVPGATACLACVFPDAWAQPTEGCQDQGVLAPVAGVIGSLQAAHGLAVLGHAPATRPGRLFAYELRSRRWRVMDVPRDRACAVCAGRRYAAQARRNDACHS